MILWRKKNVVLLQERAGHMESIHLLEETVKVLEFKSFKVEIKRRI
jgi:hypothetical protein